MIKICGAVGGGACLPLFEFRDSQGTPRHPDFSGNVHEVRVCHLVAVFVPYTYEKISNLQENSETCTVNTWTPATHIPQRSAFRSVHFIAHLST